MGKLSIRIHGCKIHRPGARVEVSPRVVVVVDNTYRFRTSTRSRTFEPNYNDLFVVGNTHRLAVIEVSVYDVVESKNLLLQGLKLEGAGSGGAGSGRHRRDASRSLSPERRGGNGGGLLSNLFRSGKEDGGSSNSPRNPDLDDEYDDGTHEANLLGRCYISMERFVHGSAKTRTYLLGTPLLQPGSATEISVMPAGVAGTITITLSSDGLGESPSVLRLDDEQERQHTERLKRFLLLVDRPKIQVLDLMIAHVRDESERLSGTSRFAAPSGTAPADTPEHVAKYKLRTALTVTNTGAVVDGTAVNVNKQYPQLIFNRPAKHETFEELMTRLCTEYGRSEGGVFRVKVRVDGCTNLNKKALNTAMISSDDVYTILRTGSEDYITCDAKLENTVVWTEGNEVVFDVVDPSTFVIHVVVMGHSSSRQYEIGRTTVGVATLALEHASERHMYLCTFDNVTLPQITGAIHLSLKPLNFGLVPMEQIAHVDDYYARLSKFFQRYDVVRVPQVDMLVRARVHELEEYMQDLIVEHGREPGSVQLLVRINEIVALQEHVSSELNDKEIRVVITMGGTAVRTKARKICRFVSTRFNEGYCFDVVRETDLIRLEVVKATDESVVYGRVDFTCLNIQRGVSNQRKLYLVGNAGTEDAYVSGIIKITLYSDEVGKNYAIDEEQERLFYDRLRRYAYRRLPENLHRVNLAVDMVFDMESFMAQLASRYGEEDPTFAIFFTVIGCRQLKSRFGGVNPYVVVRVGIDSYHTKFVKDNPEADFFEFCEFYVDRPHEELITLIVMDHSEVGDDTEIGRATISLQDVSIGQQYHDFLPLQPPPLKRKRQQTPPLLLRRSQSPRKPNHSFGLFRRSRSPGTKALSQGADEGGGERGDVARVNTNDAENALPRSPGMSNSLSFSQVGDAYASSADFTGYGNEEDGANAKQKSLGSVGFKYVVADMKIVDPTRWRLIRQQAHRDGASVAPHLRTYQADAAARAADLAAAARRSKGAGGVRDDISGSAEGTSPDVRSPLMGVGRLNSSVPPDGSAGKTAVKPQVANPFTGWMSKFRGFQKSLEQATQQMARRSSSGGGGEGGEGGSPTTHGKGGDQFHTMETAASGGGADGARGKERDDMASLQSAADVPTVNLMDEGIMDLDAFLSAPVLSNVNSVTNSAVDEDDEDDVEVNSTGGSAFRGLPGADLLVRDQRLTESDAGSEQSAFAQVIRETDRNMLRQLLANRPNAKAGALSAAAMAAAAGEESDDLDALLVHANTMSNFYGATATGRGEDDYDDAARAAMTVSKDVGPKFLRLRIVYCKNLFCATKQKPNPYLLFSTINETHRTRVEFETLNPSYNEEFCIRVDDPLRDYLHISVLTDTPYGSKKLGHCVLSVRNVQRGEWHTRWASFVVNSHKPNAFEQGSVCVSLMGENFGLEYLPSTDAENRLRERLREFLIAENPAHLHRLEWYVGEYSDQQINVLARLFGKSYTSADAMHSADVVVEVKEIKNLCIDGGMLFSGNCVVKVKANGRTYAKTRSVVGTEGTFVFNETLQFKLDNPGTAEIRFSVVANGKLKAGESFTSLLDLHKGIVQERTHVLAVGARDAHPTPSGLITCSIQSPTFGSTSAPPTAEEEQRFYRLQRFFYYYKPEEVAFTDIRYASTLNVNAYLRKLARHYGPEPGEYHLRVELQRCVNMHFASDKPIHPFAVIRCGMTEHRTAIVEGQHECVFYETFDLIVGVPALERVEVILFDFTPAKCHEIGRTQVPLATLTRGQESDLRLPLVRNAGTRFAEVNGVVELQAYTDDFGQNHMRSQSSAWFDGDDGNTVNFVPNMTQTLAGATMVFSEGTGPKGSKKGRVGSHGDPGNSTMGGAWNNLFSRRTRSQQLSSDAAQPSNAEAGGGSASVPVRKGGGRPDTPPAASSVPSPTSGGTVQLKPRDPNHTAVAVKVSITGFLGFRTQAVEFYIRVTSKEEALVRTKPMPVAELASLKEALTFEVDDQALFTDRIFTLKLGENLLLGKETVCYADFCLTQCPVGAVTEKRLRLYESKTNEFLGICRLSVDVPENAADYGQQGDLKRIKPVIGEQVMDDLASLVAKYSPKDLRKLDLSYSRAADSHRLHRALRLQLCPSAVATVYVAIHDVNLNLTTGPTSFVFKHSCTVSVACGNYTAEVAKRTAISTTNASPTILPFGMSREGVSNLDFCPLRVDVSVTGSDALLTICVNDRQNKARSSEVGRAVVSLRALLSPQVFDMGEKVTVPLVEQRRGTNRVHASLLGSITFSLYPPAYETYPRSIRFSSPDLGNFNREYVRYYIERVYRLLKSYDANSLVDLHANVYERFVPSHAWERGLPEYLSSLVERWGPELEQPDSVPPL